MRIALFPTVLWRIGVHVFGTESSVRAKRESATPETEIDALYEQKEKVQV